MKLINYLMLKFLLISIIVPLKGQEFAKVNKKDSLALIHGSTYMTNDQKGNVFIGYRYPVNNTYKVPKLAKWNGGELRIFSKKDGLQYGVVRNILIDEDGSIWLATDNGLRHLVGEREKNYKLPEPDDTVAYRKIAEGLNHKLIKDKDGYIWAVVNLYEKDDIYSKNVHAKSTELWKFRDGTWEKVEWINAGDYKKLNLTKGPKGYLIITGVNFYGQSIMKRTTGHPNTKVQNIPLKDFSSGSIDVIPASASSVDDRLIISYKPPSGTKLVYQGFSLYEIDSNTWEHFGAPIYKNVYPDLTPIPTSAYNKRNGKKLTRNNWVETFKRAEGTGIWMGMRKDNKNDILDREGGGLIYFDGKNEFKRYSTSTHNGIKRVTFNMDSSTIPEKNSLFWINGIARAKNGDLWVGTHYNGIWIIPSEKLPEKASASTGNHLNNKNQIEVYPNLVSEGSTINIELAANSDNVTKLKLINTSGKVIKNINSRELNDSGSLRIETVGLNSGVYYFKFIINNNQRVKKFVIKN